MSRTHIVRTKPRPELPSSGADEVNVGPGGGTKAPPELIESDKKASIEELADGGAGASRHTGDRSK